MSINRQCDYCEKPESEVGFIQQYEAIPQRKPTRDFDVPGQRALDLCDTCASLLTRPSEVGPKTFPRRPADPKPAALSAPVLMTDGAGVPHVISRRNRPNRCLSVHPHSKTRCVWDQGHDATVEHRAANGQHWAA